MDIEKTIRQYIYIYVLQILLLINGGRTISSKRRISYGRLSWAGGSSREINSNFRAVGDARRLDERCIAVRRPTRSKQNRRPRLRSFRRPVPLLFRLSCHGRDYRSTPVAASGRRIKPLTAKPAWPIVFRFKIDRSPIFIAPPAPPCLMVER